MKRIMIWLPACLWAAVASDLPAQSATTVQLPTFSFFTVSTSVIVPDRGATHLGGVTRASSGSTAFGPPFLPKQRGIGHQATASGMQVNVTIHNLEELDQAVLGQTAPTLPPPEAGLARRLKHAQQGTAGEAPQSLADIRAQKEAQQAEKQQDALKYFERGQKAEVEGKANVAKIYYKMAARRAEGELRQVVFARLEALNNPRVASGK